MILRSRGEHDCSHRLWRPHPEAPEPAGAPAPDELAFEAEPPPAAVEPYEPAFVEEPEGPRFLGEDPAPRGARRGGGRLLLVILLGFLGVQALRPFATPAPGLPATARAWFQAYRSASPQLVCARLLSPALAAVYTRAGGGCAGQIRRLRKTTVRLGRALQDGDTTVLTLRGPRGSESSAVLDHRHGGWRAAALIGA